MKQWQSSCDLSTKHYETELFGYVNVKEIQIIGEVTGKKHDFLQNNNMI